ncbi:hypothetical protein NC652_006437 [Populus alba x Populus x berolinensis]|uniref:Uncharacterized protein n=2 Tax=Populus TaxID=3689 RepID=A0ACC4CR84_POPAL|nr:hypothetical protein NC652_006437 [Populus alba x Populus x berolinensis]KAJ7007254.1 hypothetical protein NC653_006339 [Populus alba x Populus x berolinensis]
MGPETTKEPLLAVTSHGWRIHDLIESIERRLGSETLSACILNQSKDFHTGSGKSLHHLVELSRLDTIYSQ